ncbi:MAG: hypothetical protein ACTSWX_14785 [Promethearchaeota archaeon]
MKTYDESKQVAVNIKGMTIETAQKIVDEYIFNLVENKGGDIKKAELLIRWLKLKKRYLKQKR